MTEGASTAIVKGSISATARASRQPLARALLDVNAVIVIDVSGSMGSSVDGRTKFDAACDELARLQVQMPGQLAIVAFSSIAQFVPGGVPPSLGGGTGLAAALRLASTMDADGMRFVVISDGMPDSEDAALGVAAGFRGRIDTIFIGPEGQSAGRRFLERLAQANGGQSVADTVDRLSMNTMQLLTGGKQR